MVFCQQFSFFDYNKDFDCVSDFTTLYFLLQKIVLIAQKLEKLLSYKHSSAFVVLFAWIKQVLNAEDCIGLKYLESIFFFDIVEKENANKT